ncbi:CopG family transcriptional regulator [Candidatus Poriferisocius sp.]|uniref:CopG family transcriptional regulator n=1 Tax=Candidatus Poriferisocius sp. TaxID=3101276 RepID=UPI003B0232A0
MRNVTVSLDDETARWARIEAARRDTSLSRYVGDLLREQMTEPEAYERAQQSYLSRGPVTLRVPGQQYPTRDEVHQR